MFDCVGPLFRCVVARGPIAAVSFVVCMDSNMVNQTTVANKLLVTTRPTALELPYLIMTVKMLRIRIDAYHLATPLKRAHFNRSYFIPVYRPFVLQ